MNDTCVACNRTEAECHARRYPCCEYCPHPARDTEDYRRGSARLTRDEALAACRAALAAARAKAKAQRGDLP